MKRFQLLCIATAALVGLFAALFWLWAAQQGWKDVMLERRLNLSEMVSTGTLVGIWDHSKDAAGSYIPGRHVHLPGLVGQHLIMAADIPLEIRADVLLASIAATATGLARDPANAHAWARLAWFKQMLGGPSPESLALLRMSMFTAPADRSLLFWRIQMSGQHRDHWDLEFEASLKRQIVYAWRVSPKRLTRTILDADLVVLARNTLADQQSDLELLEALLKGSM